MKDWDQRNSTEGRIFALHAANPGLIQVQPEPHMLL